MAARRDSTIEARSLSYKHRIESYFPVALVLNILITIALIIYDVSKGEDIWAEETSLYGVVVEDMQTDNITFSVVALLMAAAGGVTGWWYSNRDAFTTCFITSMSLASTIQLDTSLTYGLMVFRGVAVVSCLVVAWMALLKSQHLQADRHHKILAGNDHHRTGGFFSTGTVIKLSYAASVAMILVALTALILIHQQKSADVGEPNWQAGRDALAISTGWALVVALVGIYGTHRRSRMILISCAVMALVVVQMVNSQQAYFSAAAAMISFTCNCDFMRDAAHAVGAVTCPEEATITHAMVVLQSAEWILGMLVAWCYFTLSERLQSGLVDKGSTDNQNAWYLHGDHSLAHWRGHFVQFISLGNDFQAAMIVTFAMLAATTAPIHEQEVGVATYHARCILIIVFLIPGFIATRALSYKASKGKHSEGWALASTVLVLYAAGLCYAMFILSHNSVVFGPNIGRLDRMHIGPQVCPDIVHADVAPCVTALTVAGQVAAGAMAPPPGFAGMATQATSSTCQAVGAWAAAQPVPRTYPKYDQSAENGFYFAAVLDAMWLVVATVMLISVQGLDEANQDASAASGDTAARRQSVMHHREQGSAVNYDQAVFGRGGAEPNDAEDLAVTHVSQV